MARVLPPTAGGEAALMSHILYISYTGILQPLGSSQVLSYLELIAREHEVSLLSYERIEDLDDAESVSQLQTRIRDAGIHWQKLRYHKRPGGIATLWDIGCGLLKALAINRHKHVDIVHCRSYVPSAIGIILKKSSRCKYLFDIRGFWVDERVDGGLWKQGGVAYRVGKWFERKFYLAADAVVSLTHAGISEIEKFHYLQGRMPPCYMIPTCTDLERFRPITVPKERPLTIGYLGAAGTWYMFKETARCFHLLTKLRPDVRFLIVNRHEHESIRRHLQHEGVSDDRVELTSASFEEVPEVISRMDATVFMIKPLFSKTASAPTKLGEFLACGKPCLVNAGIGDMASILSVANTGVALQGYDENQLLEGLKDLLKLVADPRTSKRCRETAKMQFSLRKGVQSYLEIYSTLTR